jgi:anti-sigma factor RsiW
MDLLSGDDNYSAALPAPPAPPAAPAAVVIASPERVAAAAHSNKAAPSAAAASSNAPASRIAVSFTVRGLVELLPSSQGLFDKQTRSGGGWGGLKKAMNQVVGERQGSLQISLGKL